MIIVRIFILVVLLVFNMSLLAQIPLAKTDIHKLIKQGNYAQALVVVDQKLVKQKNDKVLLHFKALSELKLDRTKQAIKTYQLLIQLYPLNPEAYNNLAGIFAKQGKLELAKETLEKGINTNKNYALLHNNINSIYLEMARESYVKALRLGVKKHTVELTLANIEQVSKKSVPRFKKRKTVIKAWNQPVITAKDEIITVLQAWAAAWSAQDVELYLSFYNKQFLPESGIAKHTWVTQRQSRLLKPRWIEIRLSDFLFEQRTNDQAEVNVTQIYRSNSFRDKSKKKFLLKRSEDGWQILNEMNFQE